MCFCFPWHKSINYNYMSNCLDNYLCCQCTIAMTWIIPLQLIYVIISWTMLRLQPVLLSSASFLGCTGLTVLWGSSLCTQSPVEVVRFQGRFLSQLSLLWGPFSILPSQLKNACAFFCFFKTWIRNSMHIQIFEQFWAPWIWIGYTYLAPFSGSSPYSYKYTNMKNVQAWPRW